jgi:cobyrinic acid a,c-diamide synthase
MGDEMNGFVVAAPRSGSGKTLVTLGLIAALRRRGLGVAAAKTGPDYIDTTILSEVAGGAAVNLDPWAMAPDRLRTLAGSAEADLLVVEGVMGLFDGSADGRGSTADLAQTLDLPIVLVLDADRQSQSIAALAHGFLSFRPGLRFAGLIVNRAASTRHEAMLRSALAPLGVPLLGIIPRRDRLHLPERHLGLVLPGEIAAFDEVVAAAADAVTDFIDLDLLLAKATPPAFAAPSASALPPLGQRIAIARDQAFAFLYCHQLRDWQAAGASLSFFSPLADEPPGDDADAVFLPGGYPELHGPLLASNIRFRAGLIDAAARGALIYGECGGFMVLGQGIIDRDGARHEMTGLLQHETRIDRPRRILGYRRLRHASPLPYPAALNGHEFHYSSARQQRGTPLFMATDALGEAQPPMGLVEGRVLGSYAHVIDRA